MKRYSVCMLGMLMLVISLTACGWKSHGEAYNEKNNDEKAYFLSMAVSLSGETTPQNTQIKQAIEAFTNTELQIQWIPYSAYEEKVKLMIASGELPKLIKLDYTPTIIATLKAGQFWELGPLLNGYHNLSAPSPMHYDNISIDGKIYGIPLFRELGRASVQYRKDWFDKLGLEPPVTLDDWYKVVRALTLNDPDGNGVNDTYGMALDKQYNMDIYSTLTRIAVSQGAPTKWMVEDGRFTPDFMTEPYFETMKLFRRLYQEKLINEDFAIVGTADSVKLYNGGRAGIQIVGGYAQTWQDKLNNTVPSAVVDVAPLMGPDGIRLPGESGNAGFLAIPKDSVRTEEEVKQILSFLDALLEMPMQALLSKGIEGRHWTDRGEYADFIDRNLFLAEVKPYRDTLPFLGDHNPLLEPVLQPELFRKNQKIHKENEAYIVSNPALTLNSDTYAERGRELEIMIMDTQTKFIIGKLDEEGWKNGIDKWRKSGGDKLIREYEEAYRQKGK
ncbi:extracellular solute-binding protein [Paenibacillus harenae]|uniref:extracellular solute-binding protein n=1 Tax=Paenibacillus harenae TaxID=306543 RepID=UPI00278E7501|nr:extracellular solute-binding protein [Paenibacillus harenae]MDQ0062503.1 putative aldouronate transport system substrate-binding protein [Paenibacillus harenae]